MYVPYLPTATEQNRVKHLNISLHGRAVITWPTTTSIDWSALHTKNIRGPCIVDIEFVSKQHFEWTKLVSAHWVLEKGAYNRMALPWRFPPFENLFFLFNAQRASASFPAGLWTWHRCSLLRNHLGLITTSVKMRRSKLVVISAWARTVSGLPSILLLILPHVFSCLRTSMLSTGKTEKAESPLFLFFCRLCCSSLSSCQLPPW